MTDFRKCGMMIDIMETGEKIMNKIAERIARLRALMEERHIDAVLVPTSDYHESEYVGEHFACRKYITGFTGSAGTALITGSWDSLESYLWRNIWSSFLTGLHWALTAA